MNTITNPIRLNIVTEFADEDSTALANAIIAGMGDDELTRNNILALCTMLNKATKIAIQRSEELKRRTEAVNNIFGDLNEALSQRRGELQREAVAKAFGIAAEPQTPYGKK